MAPKHRVYKTQFDIEKEWDALAPIRETQIIEAKDISFSSILLPTIKKLVQNVDVSAVIDVGCGLGFVTESMAENAASVTAIDISKNSINLAQKRLGYSPKITFTHSSMEEFASRIPSPRFTLAISNMTLMTVLNLSDFIASVANVLRISSHFIFTITHPCFWPRYWNYETEDWFEYNKEIIIEAPFTISLDQTKLYTTHIHRPLSMYFTTLAEAGFRIDTVIEPLPPMDVNPEYLKKWLYPRFLAVRCVRV